MRAWIRILLSALCGFLAPTVAAAPFAYVTNCESNDVSVLDIATDRVVATVPVGPCPYGVAVSPTGAHVYVTNRDGNSVSVIDAATRWDSARIPVGARPTGIAIDRSGSRVYVANVDSDSISVIDTASGEVVATVPVPAGTRHPRGIVAHPDGSRLYITANASFAAFYGYVLVLETSTLRMAPPIEVAFPDASIAIDAAGARVYVSGLYGGSIIDVAQNRMIGNLMPSNETSPFMLVGVEAAGALVYAAANAPGEASPGRLDGIYVIDPTSGTVQAWIPLDSPTGLAANAAGTRLYVANGTSAVAVIDTTTRAIVRSVVVGTGPVALGKFIGPTPSITAIEYFHREYGHYFVTAGEDEIGKLDAGAIAGWTRTGESFRVAPLGTADTPSVCRFWSGMTFAPKSSHFYTPFDWECASVRMNRDWQYEGDVFAMRVPDQTGACSAPTVPLYRLYNDGRSGAPNHRYTTSMSVRSEMIAQGWTPEGYGALGVIGCVSAP